MSMASATINQHHMRPVPVGKKTQKPVPEGGKQVAIRFSADLYSQIEKLATALSLDFSSFVRMALRENLNVYVDRVEQMERKDRREEGKS